MSTSTTATIVDRVEPALRGARVALPGSSARSSALRARLTSPVAAEEGPEVEAERARGVAAAFRPEGAWQAWLVGQVVALMGRIARAAQVERALRDRASYRAIECWDEDRALAAEELGAKLAKNPARTVAKLRQTPAGLDWLAARWRGLIGVDPAGWDDERTTLASQLAGGDTASDPTAPGYVARQLADLDARRGQAAEADAIARSLIIADLDDDAVPGLARLRRDVRALERRLQWSVDELRAARPATIFAAPAAEIPREKTNPTPAPARPIPAPAAPPPPRTKPTARAESTDRLVAILAEQQGLDESWLRNCLDGLDDLDDNPDFVPPGFGIGRPR